jgi:hypothetical protein
MFPQIIMCPYCADALDLLRGAQSPDPFRNNLANLGNTDAMRRGHRQLLGAKSTILFICFALYAVIPACHHVHWTDGLGTTDPEGVLGTFVQKGSIALRDDEQVTIRFQTPFQSSPRLAIVGFNQAYFRDIPYKKDDFQVLQLEATFFAIQNKHREKELGSWAMIEWRAEGTRQQTGNRTNQELLVDAVTKRGGRVTMDRSASAASVVGVDLHKTRVMDGDLELFEGVTSLCTVNLYGTAITDAGLLHLSGLTGLRVLNLNDTAITDNGLKSLRRLASLEELDLAHTRITDAGLENLRSQTSLQKLALNGSSISDRGLRHLHGVRNLKQLYLGDTRVTDAGAQELRQALPRVSIIR